MARKKQEEAVKQVRVTLVKSPFGILKMHKANLEALGLHKIGNSRVFNDNACVRGKIAKVVHLVKVEEI